MKLSEAMLSVLVKEGITDAFGIPGAGINGFYDALQQRSTEIRHITMRHEECCVHAASGYYRAHGKMAVALCTSGPGATNFVTGLYTAHIDSIPLIAITGQGNRDQLGKDAFQCVDIAQIAAPVAKHTVCLKDPKTAMDAFIFAIRTAQQGKPGPVVIDLPLDMQMCSVDFDDEGYTPTGAEAPEAPDDSLQAALRMVSGAKRPLILAGGGVLLAHAEDSLLAFAEQMNIPVATTYMAKGVLPFDHPLHVGTPGIQSSQISGNRAFLAADVVLAIGNRFTDRHTGDIATYRGKRRFIHINIESREIGKIFPPDLAITADAGKALEGMLRLAQGDTKAYPAFPHGIEQALEARANAERRTDQGDTPINPHRVFGEINRAFDKDTMFVTGCGITQIWSGQLQQIALPRKYLVAGGAGTLGWDIPGAIGAMVADGCVHKAVCLMGDFGFTFHAQELATAATNHIPLIVLIINNAYLGLIRQNQKFAFGYEYGVAMPENQQAIDYVGVAKGLGCLAERVFDPDALADAFARAKAADRPYVIDIICEPDAFCSMGPSLDKVKEWNT